MRALTAAVQGGDPFEGGRRQGDRDGPGGGIEPGRREGYRDAATVGRDDDGGGREPRAGRARVAQDYWRTRASAATRSSPSSESGR